ncbi:MAG: hypothetical protein H6Q70_2199 [Firmicutes bacterium]|nr:hypothetical protein [Bacillota bacterium]
MQYIRPVLRWLLPYFLKIADKYLPELLEDIVNKIKNNKKKDDVKMSETTEVLKETVATAVQTAATVAEMTEEQKIQDQMDEALAAFVAKKQSEIATTTSSYVKARDQLLIALVTAAEDQLDDQVAALGVKALAQLEKLIAKL